MSRTGPAVSVIVVSDYGVRTAEEWNYLRETLGTLRRQVFDEPVEVLLVDSTPSPRRGSQRLRATMAVK
jgi:hypothetical protein